MYINTIVSTNLIEFLSASHFPFTGWYFLHMERDGHSNDCFLIKKMENFEQKAWKTTYNNEYKLNGTDILLFYKTKIIF